MKKIMYIIVIPVIVIILAFVLLDGSFKTKKYNSIYSESYIESLDNDMEKIIAFAISAPSGHNMQPWLVKAIDDNTIELYADMNKQLPVIDADHKQLLMSQGTFIQKFAQGAGEYGYSVSIDYKEVDLESQLPMIAEVKIEKTEDVTVDTISASTVTADKAEATDILKSIDSVMSDYNLGYEYIDSGDEFVELQNMLLLGTIAESEDVAATEELLSVFRWTEYQKNEWRYGLSLNSMPDILKPFIQPIMKVASKDVQAFGQSSISMFEDRLKSDIGYVLIKCDNPKDYDYIKTGEAYQKLINECSGYTLRPAVQLLEKFDAMQELNADFQNSYGDDTEVVLILTVQLQNTSSSSNPRHLIEDIIME